MAEAKKPEPKRPSRPAEEAADQAGREEAAAAKPKLPRCRPCIPITSPRSSRAATRVPTTRSGSTRTARTSVDPRGAAAGEVGRPRSAPTARRVALEHVDRGLWHGIAPGTGPGVRARGDLRRGARLDVRRPVPLRAERRRDRPLPLGRGPARADLAGARRPLPSARGRARHELLGLGAARAGGPRRRRLQLVGRHPARHAPPRRQRRLGDLHPRTRPRHHLQVRAADAGRRVGQARRPDGPVHAGAARHRIGGRADLVRVGRRRRGWTTAPRPTRTTRR